MYLIPPLTSVPTHLWDGTKMVDYFNLWWKFQSVLHTVSEKQVATYRDLWLQLSKLSNHSGNANQGTVSQLLIFIFVSTLLSLYGVLSGLLSYKYGRTEIMLSINSVIGIITTVLTCDFAYKANEQVGVNFVRQLSEEMSINKAIEKEMRLFLTVAVANPPEISLGGFAVINRSMTVSLANALVVLSSTAEDGETEVRISVG
uniref:Uncharacterized protein n=1 Tax=Timema poppense TaxID=170557 RepID=A0A7R9D3D5_TIMPO|nr:unnamed protein product [Timema poppensis]